eukprot:scaffold22639_cov105-Cylindrotheca_fusiformis.AAC.9
MDNNNVPIDFICPISWEVMRDPLMNRYGQNYDRQYILEWLVHNGNDHCPITRQPLSPSQLVPNNALKKQIRRWSMEQRHGISTSIGDDDDDQDQQEEEEYSYIEERGVIGIVEFKEGGNNNNNNKTLSSTTSTSSTNPLADLVDLFDHVLEITTAD